MKALRSPRIRGFTLIEYHGRDHDPRDPGTALSFRELSAALMTPALLPPSRTSLRSCRRSSFYRLDNGRYPTTEQGLQALISKPAAEPVPRTGKQGGYLERSNVPKDPWATPTST